MSKADTDFDWSTIGVKSLHSKEESSSAFPTSTSFVLEGEMKLEPFLLFPGKITLPYLNDLGMSLFIPLPELVLEFCALSLDDFSFLLLAENLLFLEKIGNNSSYSSLTKGIRAMTEEKDRMTFQILM